jgi:carbonic anhydrase
MNITDPHLKRILDNNSKWVDETNKEDPEFFANLIKPQQPKYLYFGCSDSRVPANQILGLGYRFYFRTILILS